MTGTLLLTKYIQSAFVLGHESESFAFDFGSESTEDTVAQLAPVTATFVSHIHPDHLHVPHLMRLAAPVYAPKDVVTQIADKSLRTIAIAAGDTIRVGGLEVEAFQADHGPNISAPIENLGFVLRLAARTIVFAGDVALAPTLPAGPYDAILVPVGSSKVFSPEEAAAFIQAIDHHGIVIPIHYHGRADRQAGHRFYELAHTFCDVRVCDVGESIEF